MPLLPLADSPPFTLPCPDCGDTRQHLEYVDCRGLLVRLFFWCFRRRDHEHWHCSACGRHWVSD